MTGVTPELRLPF